MANNFVQANNFVVIKLFCMYVHGNQNSTLWILKISRDNVTLAATVQNIICIKITALGGSLGLDNFEETM